MKTIVLHAIDNSPGKFRVPEKTAKRILEQGNQCEFTFDDGYESIYETLKAVSPEIRKRVCVFVVVGRIGQSNDWDKVGFPLTGRRLLDWEQLLDLSRLGVTIGSHGLAHVDLRKLHPKRLLMEVRESKLILEEKLGRPVDSFSYPYGRFNGRVITAVKEAGYKEAYTDTDSIWKGRGNPYRKRRIMIEGGDSPWKVWMKLTGLWDFKSVWELPIIVADKAWRELKRSRG